MAETLEAWGRQLFGLDLYPEFIRAARARLVLAAALRGRWDATLGLTDIESWFPGIRVGNGLAIPEDLGGVTHVVLIRHLTLSRHRKGLSGPVGKFRQQPYLSITCWPRGGNETNIAAILPDVLRSGTRYANWRVHVSRQAILRSVSIWDCLTPGRM